MREMERVHQHAGQKIGVGGDQMMEHSGTALPTCYRIFYYYGDFSVTLSFAKTLKRESRERDRAEGKLPQARKRKQ